MAMRKNRETIFFQGAANRVSYDSPFNLPNEFRRRKSDFFFHLFLFVFLRGNTQTDIK